ncbi:DUF4406 domain-containing protein [Pseudomonas oryziphila]|uniref:DUF4406 domain-containing protein n=1 Tax=Pseudomonas oryziphila TaxID=2894079 RepID=A0ABN5TKT3_9PSED|nr:DUF4406 domain-containing protein [Pseudomonas oryziphila]AZL74564.1 DUF4406 domain-containing protein [Pseudomonas oryziphila]
MTDLIELQAAPWRVYISGPMSGLPDLNYPAFHAVAGRLRAEGLEVENPAENPEPPCGSWSGYMRLALVQISKCNGMIVLPGWTKSRGARLEVHIAKELGLLVTCAEGAEELMP